MCVRAWVPLVIHTQIPCNWRNAAMLWDCCSWCCWHYYIITRQLILCGFQVIFSLLSALHNGFGCDNRFNHFFFARTTRLIYIYICNVYTCAVLCLLDIDLRAHARSHTHTHTVHGKRAPNSRAQSNSWTQNPHTTIATVRTKSKRKYFITLSIFNLTTWNMKWLYCYLMSRACIRKNA